jgi:ABC-type transport system involved in multi-copper enzyme maturation permease subunit
MVANENLWSNLNHNGGMVMVASSLLKKELKQNAVIFLAPYLFLGLIIILNRKSPDWLPPQWAELLTVSLPLAMAGAYGLQAFDLEENSRTKEFLMTKPLTLPQIVWTKYFCGLGVLLPLTVLWIASLLPQSLVPPTLDNLNSFWLTLFLMVTVILYSASFLAGILLKGPIKLLAGIGLGVVALGWSGLVWCESVTTIYYANLDRFPGIALTLIYLFSLLLIGFFLKVFIGVISQILKNTFSWKANRRAAGFTLAVFVLLPLMLWQANSLNHPVISSFDSLAHSLTTAADWFVGLEGVRQPDGKLTALTDARGRLGIAASFAKPRVVYVSNTGIMTKPLLSMAWSPDGHALTFCDNGHLKLYTLTTKATRDLGPGALAIWSRDSRQLLVGQMLETPTAQPGATAAPPRRLSLTLLDLHQPEQIHPVAELYTNDLAIEWDSLSNTLFAVNHAGVLTTINLTTSQTQKIALLPPKQKESVFYAKIAPPDSTSSTLALILCSFGPTQAQQHKTYTIRWYDLDLKTQKITLTGTLTDCSYKDIIPSVSNHSLLVRSYNNGLYRQIKVK